MPLEVRYIRAALYLEVLLMAPVIIKAALYLEVPLFAPVITKAALY